MPEQRKTFHQDLDEIRDDIVRLGALVGEVIPRGTDVLLTNNMHGAQAIIEADDELDDLSLRIEERCYHVLALQQPMASDLRSIVTGLWLTGELERSGDLMVNVAKGTRRIYGVTLDPKLRGLIERMSEEASRLMKLALDAYAERVLTSVPPERRVLVTAHDAFNYFGRRYGFDVLGVQGVSTESEAGLRQIENLVGVLVERKIPAVFVESTISERSVRALIAGAKAKGRDVTIGGELFSDAMGKPGSYEGTYVGMIDHNVTTIARALGVDAPSKGFNGRLARKD